MKTVNLRDSYSVGEYAMNIIITQVPVLNAPEWDVLAEICGKIFRAVGFRGAARF